MIMIVYPRETPPHIRTARAQPPAAHRRLPPPPPQTRETQFPQRANPTQTAYAHPPKEGPGPGEARSEDAARREEATLQEAIREAARLDLEERMRSRRRQVYIHIYLFIYLLCMYT